MKFSYKARTQKGELQVGNVEASSQESAIQTLNSHNLFVLSIEEVKREQWYDRISDFFKRVKSADLMIFTRQFSTLLSSEVPLSDSLRNLYKQTTNPVLKEVIGEISSDIGSGFSLSQALEKQDSVFSEFYINMVKSAEVTGRLNEVLGFLADYLEKQATLTSKVKNALIYPAFVVVLFFVVMIIMVSVVLPQIAPIFTEANVELPVYTQIVLFVGNFTASYWWGLLIFAALVGWMLIDYFRTEEGKAVKDEILIRMPVFGGMFKKLYIARFAESSRMLIKGGLTIPQAVEISSHTIGNTVYRDLLRRASDEVRKGKQLSTSLASMPEFPPLVSQLVSVGESTGRLEGLLERIGTFYTREVEDTVNNLVSLIQPILMVVIGLLVAFLFASILVPLYNLSEVF
ncbi:MAG: type II secretion system F family protein [Candidatus Paceibacterota bacterium]